jgi:hypothetical protein
VTDEFIRDLRRRVDLIALTLARLAQFSVDIDPMANESERLQFCDDDGSELCDDEGPLRVRRSAMN